MRVCIGYWIESCPAAGEVAQPGYLIVDAFGAVALLLLIALYTIPSFCGCDPSYDVVAILLLMVASTGIRHASSFMAIPDWLARTATISGYGSLVLLLVLGLSRNISQIQQIL